MNNYDARFANHFFDISFDLICPLLTNLPKVLQLLYNQAHTNHYLNPPARQSIKYRKHKILVQCLVHTKFRIHRKYVPNFKNLRLAKPSRKQTILTIPKVQGLQLTWKEKYFFVHLQSNPVHLIASSSYLPLYVKHSLRQYYVIYNDTEFNLKKSF